MTQAPITSNRMSAAVTSEFSEWAAQWIHPRFGLVKEIVEAPTPSGVPPFYRLIALSSDQFVARGANPDVAGAGRKTGLGYSLDFQTACWSAIGEAIERYAAGVYYDDELVSDTGHNLGKSAKPVEEMILNQEPFDETHMRYVQYSPDIPRRWSRAKRLSDGKDVFIPAYLCWFGYKPAYENEAIGLVSSNGLGAGRTRAASCCSGVLELIERDALMCHWYLGIKPVRLKIDKHLSSRLPLLLMEFFAERELEANFLLLRNEFNIPVVFCLIVDELVGVLGLGGCASLDIGEACNKSVHEAMMVYSDQISKRGAPPPSGSGKNIKLFSDHINFYRDRSRWSALEFLRKGGSEISISQYENETSSDSFHTATEKLERIHSKLNAFGYEILELDMTRADIEAAGFYTTKMIVPGLQPLLLGPVIPGDQRRLASFSKKNCEGVGEVRKIIHPFP